MGGVGEAEDVVADEVAGGRCAEGAVVGGGGDDGELFELKYQADDGVPCNLLARDVIEDQKLLSVSGETCKPHQEHPKLTASMGIRIGKRIAPQPTSKGIIEAIIVLTSVGRSNVGG